MGKRPIIPPSDLQNFVTPPTRRTIRKRKVSNGNIGAAAGGVGRPAKAVRLNSDADDDEDSSSNDTHVLNSSTKHANNSSILLSSTLKLEQSSPATNDSPRPVYTLRPSVVNGTILYDLTQKPWRLGNPIGKGNFGEIFLASDNITIPVSNENAKFVVKIEPHSNGPLFVEIHCLMNTAKTEGNLDGNEVTVEEKIKQGQRKPTAEPIKPSPPLGIPYYIASGSHFFGDARYRFLVLERFDQDLHSLIKNSCVAQKSVLTLAIQIVSVLENLHDKGYCHNDVKSQNLMISKCKYYMNKNSTTLKKTTAVAAAAKTTKTLRNASKCLEKYEEKQPTTDSGNSSEQEANDYDDDGDEEFILKRKTNKRFNGETTDDEDDEDFDDGTTTSNSNSLDIYKTPIMRGRQHRRPNNRAVVQYSGSNPVRSCRRPQRTNSIYEEMVNSHYLRPSNKNISYSEFFDEDGNSIKGDSHNVQHNDDADSRDTHFNSTEDDDSNTCLPISLRRRYEQKTCSASKQKSHSARTENVINSNKAKKSPPKRLTRRQEKLLNEQQKTQCNLEINAAQQQTMLVEAEHIFLIDFGLASKYIDRGVHRPFIMDQRRAHDGTLEFTSRDAHMGAHSRRSDLECLGYNLLYWSQGFLPWKDAATQQQQEKVHRAKEYLMTDVREMLKLIYGKDVPKYLGEFLHLVGQLAYHERPEYARYRRLFEQEYRQLGYSLANMCLDSQDIARGCVRIKKDHGAGKHDFFEQNNKQSNSHILSIMKSGGTPFQERGSIGDRVSPKNLRSKSGKKTSRKKKFCWAEVLSQDPDQIARERAEKEFDRELNDEEERPVRRYEGNPTYAILDLISKREETFKTEDDDAEDGQDDVEEEEDDNEATETSEVEAEASDDDEEVENDGDEDEEVGGEDDEAVSGSDESLQEISGSDDDDDEDTANEMSQDEDDDDDDDENNDSNDDDETDNVESDISEASSNSEQYGTRGRNKQRNTVAAYQKTARDAKTTKPTRRAVSAANSRSSKSTTASSNASRVGRSRGSSTKITTRSNGPIATSMLRTTKSMTKHQQKSKRVVSMKTKRSTKVGRHGGGGAFAASAAGEVEQQALKQFLYDHHDQSQHQKLKGKMSKKRGGRRRSPQKTENVSELINGGGGRNGGSRVIGMYGVEDDSNSNLMMLNVWKMSNENIYARNAAAAAKSITSGGGGMVTRHYRK